MAGQKVSMRQQVLLTGDGRNRTSSSPQTKQQKDRDLVGSRLENWIAAPSPNSGYTKGIGDTFPHLTQRPGTER